MRRIFASMTLAVSGAVAMLALTGVGTADPDKPAPPAGDDRAVSHSGNVVAADCPTLWPGTTAVEVDATITEDTYITFTVPDGTTIEGAVVKGGDGYNVYDIDHEQLPPWVRLHAPLAGNSGAPAAISHWFVCGVTEQTTSTTSPTSSTTTSSSTTDTTSSSPTSTSSPTESSSGTSVPSSTVTTTSSASVPPVVSDDDLASTGANVGWLVLLGGALLLAGAALIGIPHVRKALLRR